MSAARKAAEDVVPKKPAAADRTQRSGEVDSVQPPQTPIVPIDRPKRSDRIAPVTAALKPGEVFRAFQLVDNKMECLFNGISIPEQLAAFPWISPGAKLCLGQILRCYGVTGEAEPSFGYIGKMLGCSGRQVFRYVGELELWKLVKHTKRRNPDTPQRNDTNLYEPLWHVFYTMTVDEITAIKKREDALTMTDVTLSSMSLSDVTLSQVSEKDKKLLKDSKSSKDRKVLKRDRRTTAPTPESENEIRNTGENAKAPALNGSVDLKGVGSAVALTWQQIENSIGEIVDRQAREYITGVLHTQNLALDDLLEYLSRRPLNKGWRNRIVGLRQVAAQLGDLRQYCHRERQQQSSAPLFSTDDLKSHLNKAAHALRQRSEPSLLEVAAWLDTVSGHVDQHANDLESIEKSLTAMEEKIISALRVSQTNEDLLAIREALNRELQPYRGRMAPDQLALLERRYVNTALLERAKLPRLSLFYLH